MAIVLTTPFTEQGALRTDANTYIALADAHAYFEARLDSREWENATEERQQQALLTAMRVLDSLPFIGARYQSTQPLAWPRVATTPAERLSRLRERTGHETLFGESGGLYDLRGRLWPATAIPAPIKHAQCEIALAMLTDQFWNAANMRLMVLRSRALQMDYQQPAGYCAAQAREYLAGLVRPGSSVARA